MELVAIRLGSTIIHAKVGTNLLKKPSRSDVVKKTTEIVNDLKVEVQGERVGTKRAKNMSSGNFSFYMHNRKQKEWLRKYKHRWNEQLHTNLQVMPVMYSVLCQFFPLDWDLENRNGTDKIVKRNEFEPSKHFFENAGLVHQTLQTPARKRENHAGLY